MSTNTLEAPASDGVIIPRDEVSAAAVANASWVQRLSDGTARAVRTGWRWFTSAINWIVDRVVDGYRWVEDKTVRGSKWLWSRARTNGIKAKIWGKRAWFWTGNHIVAGWNWIGDAAVWGWSYISPVLRWTSTPVRITLGTIFGAAWVAAFGPTLLFVGAAAWLTYFLVTGRSGVNVQSERELERQLSKRFKGDKLVLSKDERQAIANRMADLEMNKERNPTRAQGAVLAGRQYLLHARLTGSAMSAGDIYKKYKSEIHKNLSDDELAGFPWMQASTGIRTEDALVRRMLATGESEIVPQPVTA